MVINTAVTAGQPSPLNVLNRGIMILKHLPMSMKNIIERDARKFGVPENCMDRDWVFQQLYNYEKFKTPNFSWSVNDSKSTNKKSDDTDKKSDKKSDDTDLLQIECVKRISPECEKNFSTSKAWWVTRDLSLPKSCKPCRDMAKAQNNTTTAAMVTMTQQSDSDSELDVEDEDLMFCPFADYAMSM